VDVEVIGTNKDNRYWFQARITGFRESYPVVAVLPTWLNPWAMRARSRARRFTPEWDDWMPAENGMIVDLFCRSTETCETGGQYERILDYIVCVVAETHTQARIRAQECLNHRSFVDYVIEELGETEVATIETTPTARRAIEDQMAVHPLIGGEYTPSVPEIHLVGSSDDIAGVVRMELSRAQLRQQIARVQKYRRRVYDWGQFSVEFQLDEQMNERMLAILTAIAAENEGTLIASVSLTDTNPEVAVAIVLDRKGVERMLDRARERDLATGEMARWRYPLAEKSIDGFLDDARTAMDAESPGVVGESPFVGTGGVDDGVTINA
jgi:hypothetical protein